MNVFERLAHPWWTMAASGLLMAVMTVVLVRHGAPLRTDAVPRGIGDFELAGTKTCADHILKEWGPERKRVAVMDTLLDFLFIPCYATFLALFWFWLASITKGARPLSLVLLAMAWLQWFAGILDVVENLCMLAMLTGSTSDLLARTSQVCATVKFVITIVMMKVLFTKGACT